MRSSYTVMEGRIGDGVSFEKNAELYVESSLDPQSWYHAAITVWQRINESG